MFGTLAPRLKGGFTKLQQVASASYWWVKGSPEFDLRISAAEVNIGNGRSVTIEGGAVVQPVENAVGGAVNLVAGAGPGIGSMTGTGGAINLTAGVGSTGAGATGTGGAVNLTAGAAAVGSASGTGGAINLTAGIGATNSGAGGKITLKTGDGGGTSRGGTLELFCGGGNTGLGANVQVRSGTGNTSPGNIELDACGGSGAVATNAAGGTVQLPSCAGTPTGSITVIGAGLIPLRVDSTNNRLWAINGSWKRANFGGAINSQSADYTCTLSDGGPERAILHPSTDANARTFTIPANGSVAYDVGTVLTIINDSANAVTIAITTDTLVLEGAGTTGSRTLAQYGRAVATKINSTRWYITGTNLT